MACERVLLYLLAIPASPEISLAPPAARIGQHLLLLPLLLICYGRALSIGWPKHRRAAALLKHLALCGLFALAARPALMLCTALQEGSWRLVVALVRPQLDPELLRQLWLSASADFALSYGFGLALLVGVSTYRQLEAEKERATRLQDECTLSRLQALRRQLSPHFLFNTLHATVAVVRSQPAVAEQMLVRLAELLRRAFRDGEFEQVALADEVEFVRKFLEIQALRHAGRLAFELDVPGELADALVPELLLQPLAENAVVHAAHGADERIRVRVSARRERDELVLEVQNSPGAKPVRTACGDGIGLGATRERLRTLFGNRQELALMVRDEGVVAQVRIPLARAPHEAAAA
jgi:sensor histidine kinase YesM